MNTQDRLVELWLTLVDRVLDAVTLGWWSRWQGDRRIYIEKGG